jgi:hypothetical protein
MRMPVSYVCMKESRPGDGHLCFCRQNRCNSASGMHDGYMIPLVLVGLLTLIWTHCRWRHTLCDVIDFSHGGGKVNEECDKNRESSGAVSTETLHKSEQDSLDICYQNSQGTIHQSYQESVGAG